MRRRPIAAIAAFAAAASLVAAGLLFAAGTSRRPLTRAQTLDQLGRAEELDVSFGYAPEKGLIAVSNDSGKPALSLFDVRRRSRTRLPLEGVWTRRPVLSPDGNLIVYHQLDVVRRSWEHDLSLFDVRTESVRSLRQTGDDDFVSRAAFSPDSRVLVYELVHRLGEHQWQEELRRVDLDTFVETRLFLQREVTARAPAFTPDGRSLYFVSGPCLRHIDSRDGHELDRACVEGAVWPSSMPEWPAVHPGGRWVAFPVELRGCTRIAIVDNDSHVARVADEHECATRPVWIGGATPRLAYIEQRPDGSRVPRWRALGEAASHGFGFNDGITYDLAPTGSGKVLALLGAPSLPRSLVELSTDGAPSRLFTPLAEALLENIGPPPFQVYVRAPDGLQVPMRVFPGRRSGGGRQPALLFLHGGVNGIDDIAPRIYPEISFFNAMGLTVYAPNFRGSTGYGAEYRARVKDVAGKQGDVIAAARYVLAQPDVDPTQLYAFGSCFGNSLIVPAIRAGIHFAAVVDWIGSPPRWWSDSWTSDDRPPVLWLNAKREAGTEGYALLARTWQAGGAALDFVDLDEAHWILDGDARARGLQAARAFIDRRRGVTTSLR